MPIMIINVKLFIVIIINQYHDYPQLLELQASLPSLFDTDVNDDDDDDDDGGGDDDDDDDGPSIELRFCKRINWTDG